jgi:hypothetical protein
VSRSTNFNQPPTYFSRYENFRSSTSTIPPPANQPPTELNQLDELDEYEISLNDSSTMHPIRRASDLSANAEAAVPKLNIVDHSSNLSADFSKFLFCEKLSDL